MGNFERFDHLQNFAAISWFLSKNLLSAPKIGLNNKKCFFFISGVNSVSFDFEQKTELGNRFAYFAIDMTIPATGKQAVLAMIS